MDAQALNAINETLKAIGECLLFVSIVQFLQLLLKD